MTNKEKIEGLERVVNDLVEKLMYLETDYNNLRKEHNDLFLKYSDLKDKYDGLMIEIDRSIDAKATSIETDIDESLQHFLYRYEERQHDINNAIGLLRSELHNRFVPSIGIVGKRKSKKEDTGNEGDIP